MADTTWRERLKEAIATRETSNRALSKAVGAGEGYISELFASSKEPSFDRMLQIARVLEVSLTWLVYGVEMSHEAEQLLRLFSRLSDPQKAAFLQLAESIAAEDDQRAS